MLYDSLSEGCLDLFYLELDEEIPLRHFINLIDNDGEETFISLQQIILMEFDSKLLYNNEGDEEPAQGDASPNDFPGDDFEEDNWKVFFISDERAIIHEDAINDKAGTGIWQFCDKKSKFA